jgi:hypothetical protein
MKESGSRSFGGIISSLALGGTAQSAVEGKNPIDRKVIVGRGHCPSTIATAMALLPEPSSGRSI